MAKGGGKGVSISGYKGKQAIELTPGPGAYELVGDDLKRPCSAKYSLHDKESARGNAPTWESTIPLVQDSITPTIAPTINSHTPKSQGRRTSKEVIPGLDVNVL